MVKQTRFLRLVFPVALLCAVVALVVQQRQVSTLKADVCEQQEWLRVFDLSAKSSIEEHRCRLNRIDDELSEEMACIQQLRNIVIEQEKRLDQWPTVVTAVPKVTPVPSYKPPPCPKPKAMK